MDKIWDNILLNVHAPTVVIMQVMLAILKIASEALLATGIDDVLEIIQCLPRERVGDVTASHLLRIAWSFEITKESLSEIETEYLKRKCVSKRVLVIITGTNPQEEKFIF